ncbi:hypothetical protein ABE10_01105, partial [Bacillus toyonensis]|nr:hypothetical protein [Bacillus toyonensis]
PRPADAARLDHELAGLGDRHEVPRGLRVGHRDRPAGRDERLEGRKHRASAAEHVPEAHGEVPLPRTLPRPGGQLLGQALGVAEDAGRVRGLVGGHVHEVRDPRAQRRIEHVARADHVGLPRLVGVLLQHREVLQRRSVEDHLGTTGVEDLVQQPA